MSAYHNRHIWEVPKSEELKKCTFTGNHKAHILIQFPLILYSCAVFLYIAKSVLSTYFYILFYFHWHCTVKLVLNII